MENVIMVFDFVLDSTLDVWNLLMVFQLFRVCAWGVYVIYVFSTFMSVFSN